jgi:hypothetical protein
MGGPYLFQQSRWRHFVGIAPAGMTMVSACASSSGWYGACTMMPPAARIGPSSMAHTAKSYQSTSSSGRSSANSSTVQPNSKVHRRSYASATTRCFFMAQS